MEKENKLCFVPLVGNNLQPRKVGIRGSASRQKEGLKLIKGLPLLPRLTAVLPPQGREMRSGFTPYCHPELDSGSRRCFIKGFTLIELLVVVLIIGILASVALPQYQKAVEKTRMLEATILVRAIANSHQRYYLEHGKFLGKLGWDDLDIVIPGKRTDSSYSIGTNRIRTKHFVYSTNSTNSTDFSTEGWLASAYRVMDNSDGSVALNYRIWISQDEPNRIRCAALSAANSVQRILCSQLNTTGTL